MVDLDAIRLTAIYASPIAVDAVITTPDGVDAAVRAVDKTAGVDVSLDAGSGGVGGVLTVKPAADIRMTELADNNLGVDDIDDGTMLINGVNWRIRGCKHKPGVGGEAKGELRVFLTDEGLNND